MAQIMSDEVENDEAGFLDLLTNPSKALANWYVGLGVWGLFLAILNIAGVLHPTYRISWGGLLTFELWDSWQGTDQSFYVTPGDGIFMIICGTFSFLGIRSLAGADSINDWAMSLLKNDSYKDLVGGDDNDWNKTIGSWCVVLGLGFYFSWGIMYTTWIDLGVYAVSVVLLASGLILRSLADLEDED